MHLGLLLLLPLREVELMETQPAFNVIRVINKLLLPLREVELMETYCLFRLLVLDH